MCGKNTTWSDNFDKGREKTGRLTNVSGNFDEGMKNLPGYAKKR